MKIKVKEKAYSEIMAEPQEKHIKPKRPNMLFRTLLKLVSLPDLIATDFKVERIGMDKLGKKEPCLFLMNHSSFIDLEIISSILYPRPFNIIATTDSFIGKAWLMRQIGCIPTKKFTSDISLIRDIVYAVNKLKNSIVLYPEASYSFDGTATPLPKTVGGFVKKLGIPVVMVTTYGAFARDPLYNNLQRRKVKVSAVQKYVLSPDDICAMSADELQTRIEKLFSFDNFRWQRENGIKIDAGFRADYLERVLYKCPACGAEGKTLGKGDTLTCSACGKDYRLTEDGEMQAVTGETEHTHSPDWYSWERVCVREELTNGSYRLDVPVEICVSRGIKSLYRVGEGRLIHDGDGFKLTGCDGELEYFQSAISTYSLYSDFNWYEIGDVICIGNSGVLYYCFPKAEGVSVAKVRLATEELFKLKARK